MMRLPTVRKIISISPEVYYAKFYDYKAVKVDNHYEIWQRTMEGRQWYVMMKAVIIDGILFHAECCEHECANSEGGRP